LYYDAETSTLTTTNFNSLSDLSLKENINEIENALDIIEQLESKTFNWKNNGTKAYGFIAQQVEKCFT